MSNVALELRGELVARAASRARWVARSIALRVSLSIALLDEDLLAGGDELARLARGGHRARPRAAPRSRCRRRSSSRRRARSTRVAVDDAQHLLDRPSSSSRAQASRLLAEERDRRSSRRRPRSRARAERARHLLLLLGVELLPAGRSLERRERRRRTRRTLASTAAACALVVLRLERARVLVDRGELPEERLALEEVLERRGVLARARREMSGSELEERPALGQSTPARALRSCELRLGRAPARARRRA